MMEPQRHSLQAVADGGDNPAAQDELIDAIDAGVEYVEGRDEWRAESIIRQWSPEHQLIGALMYLSADSARPILELVPDTAVWRPITRRAIAVIRALVAEGRDPDPVAVLHIADNQPTEEFISQPPDNDWGLPDRGSRHHQFALYLADAYRQVVDPHHAYAYAGEVLADAYRRTFRFHGIRMQQLGESNASRGDLAHYLFAMQDELADLKRRAEAAAQSDKEPASAAVESR
jgi:replicative DNA helicase